MDINEFYEHIFQKQQEALEMPSNKKIAKWAVDLIHLLFPERDSECFRNAGEVEVAFKNSEAELYDLLTKTKACDDCDNFRVSVEFFRDLPSVYEVMQTDAQAIMEGDPAAQSIREVIRTYPGFTAICMYRLANLLYRADIPLIPRILTEYAHSKTGIDIHPGAQIGRYFFIDHGTGLVIGETCTIGEHVKLYQGVTLGALSVDKKLTKTKRHPTIEDHVVIYAGATILGGNTTIGHHSVIGGNVWLTSGVKPYTTVYHLANTKIDRIKKVE